MHFSLVHKIVSPMPDRVHEWFKQLLPQVGQSSGAYSKKPLCLQGYLSEAVNIVASHGGDAISVIIVVGIDGVAMSKTRQPSAMVAILHAFTEDTVYDVTVITTSLCWLSFGQAHRS